MTEEWQKILGWGIEGEDYLVDSNGMFYRNQEQRDRANDPTARLSNQAYTLWAYAPKMDGTFSDGNATAPGYQPKEFYDSLKDYDKQFLDHYGYRTWADFLNPPPPNRVSYPAWSIDLVQGSAAQIADTRLNELGTKYLPRAILSDPADFDSVWNDYVNELHTCDIAAYMARIQGVLDWRAEHWK
jgi:putative aldouronate transport system substrate-binding protein